ncbi:polyprenyl synthetase family protein [Buchananella felis]|uniref:polyprenyl synthetase family protein n=1 Tax=Buchananella felis TaxID=3231492 RepID=UPI003527554D
MLQEFPGSALRPQWDGALLAVQEQWRAELADLVEAAELLDYAAVLLAGGKRKRAELAALGYWAAGGDPASQACAQAGAALELFQAAALAHDDLMDDSATRRSHPTTHVQAAHDHAARGWVGSAAQFGLSAAVLLGDLLLAQSHRTFAAAAALADRQGDDVAAGPRGIGAGQRALAAFSAMSVELQAGQYLDTRAQTQPLGAPDALASLERALTFKSARYSVEHPLRIGAALGGAGPELVAALGAVGRPLGIAFQLRDDLLGVFGDPAVTGKPAGDDVRVGKRTVLAELAHASLSPANAAELAALLARAPLGEADTAAATALIAASGAAEQVEARIAQLRGQYEAAIEALPQEPVRLALAALAHELVDREA